MEKVKKIYRMKLRKTLNNNAYWAVVAVLVNAIINFTIVPYISENIGVEAYGFVILANTVISYVDIVSVAFNAFACRYVAIEYHRRNFRKASKYYTSIFFADLFLVIGIAFIGFFAITNIQYIINVSDRLESDVKILFAIVFLRYSLVLLRNAFDITAFIKNRLDLAEKFRGFSYLLQACVLLGACILFEARVWYVGFASFVAALFLLIVQYLYSIRLTPELNINFTLFSGDCIKDFLTAGIWNSINNIGNLLNSGLDLLITNKILTELLMGMVSVSKSLGSLCYTLVVAISTSFRPKQLESYSLGDTDALVIRLKQSMRFTGAICAIIIAGFNVCGFEFIRLWLPGQDVKLIFQLSLIVLLSDIMIGVVHPLYFVFTLTKKLKLPCFITITMGAVNVTSMYLLIKYTGTGVYAVVLTTMALNFVHFIDTPIYSAYCLKLDWKTFYPPILVHVLNCVANIIVLGFMNKILPDAKSWIVLLLKIFILGIGGVITSLFITTTTFEKRNIVDRCLKRIFVR